jgi:hypothetical protein
MHTLIFDGDSRTGSYSVRCTNCTSWSGWTIHHPGLGFVPMEPIAEAATHNTLEHASEPLTIHFSRRFSAWLEAYWRRSTALQTVYSHTAALSR